MKYKIINRKKLYATMFIDIIGNIAFLPLKMFKKNGVIDSDIKEILIIRTAYIGDILMTLPILKPLKEKFPKARISFIASREGGELLKGNPYINRIFYFNPFWFYKSSIKEYLQFIKRIRRERFDLVIEARGDIREILFIVSFLKARFKLSYGFGGGAYLLTHVVPFDKMKHRVEYHLDLVRYLGCSIDIIDWGVYLSNDEKIRIREILKLNSVRKPFILVHPGARLSPKKWLTINYAILCDMLINKYGIDIVLLGSKQEKESCNNIIKNMKYKPVNLAGKLSLRELAGVISEADLFICNDSAPMHIASAMKTPIVAIFGPSKSIETRPYFNNSCIVEKDFPCRNNCDETTCRHNVYHECMRSITPGEVFQVCLELIERVGIRRWPCSTDHRTDARAAQHT